MNAPTAPTADRRWAREEPLITPRTVRAQPEPWTRALHIATIVVLTVAVFWPTLQNGFLPLGFDDGLILETPAIRALSWDNLWTLIAEFNRVNYIPVTLLSFALHYAVWGFNALGYHLTNVLLQVAAAVLWYLFVLPLVPSAKTAFLAALIFAVHPVQMEAVSLAVEQKTLLSGVFCLSTLLAYRRWRTGASRRAYAFSLLFFILAALSKAMAVSVAPLLVLYDYVFVSRRVRLWDKLPFFVLALATSAAAVGGHAHEGALVPLHGGSLLAHVLIIARVTLEYVASLFLPLDLSPYYYPRQLIYAPLNWLALATIVFVCGYVSLHRRRFPWSFFCLWWFVLALLPESNIVPLAQLRADRYLYLPSMGFALWVAIGIEAMADRLEARRLWRHVIPALRFVPIAAMAVLTYGSAGVWRNDVSAWTRVVERHPWCMVAYEQLGRAYYEQNDYLHAERALLLAVRSPMPMPDAHLYLAKMYAERGFRNQAAAQLSRYRALLPDDPRGLKLQTALGYGG